MTSAFLFPGQGSVFAAMGRDLAERWPAARSVYAQASELLGRDLAGQLFGASKRDLVATETAHLAVFLHSLAAHSVLRQAGVEACLASGHSLGQWAAATATGALRFDTALRLVARRGEILAAACRRHPGGMLAIRGAAGDVGEALRPWLEDGEVVISGYNGPRETVVSGVRRALREALRALRTAGLGASMLAVDGPFHSPGMAAAARVMAAELAAVAFDEPHPPVVSTRDGSLLVSGEEVRRELTGHVLSAVRWDLAMDSLAERGTRRWVEVGPGRSLCGLVGRRDRSSARYATSRARDLEATLGAFARLPEPVA